MYKDLTNFYIQLYGYIRRCSLNDNDYSNILIEFDKIKSKLNYEYTEKSMNWIYYQIDILILKFYSNYKTPKSGALHNRVRLKIRQTYDKIKSTYPEFLVDSKFHNLNISNNSSINEIKNCLSIIVDAGYPHVTLVFLYFSILHNRKIDYIVNELSHKRLEDIYNSFINIYSEESGLPTFIISLFTIKLKDQLNAKLKDIIYKNDSITPKKLAIYLESIVGDTVLNIYFGKNKALDISLWSDKVRRKVLNNLLRNIINSL